MTQILLDTQLQVGFTMASDFDAALSQPAAPSHIEPSPPCFAVVAIGRSNSSRHASAKGRQSGFSRHWRVLDARNSA